MIRFCVYCGDSFSPSKFHPNQFFCSATCRRLHYQEFSANKKIPAQSSKEVKKVEKICYRQRGNCSDEL